MNIRRTGRSAILPLLILLFALAAPLPARADEPAGINSEQRHITCTALSDAAQAYYTGAYAYEQLSSLPGASDSSDSLEATQDNPLYDALHNLMQSTLTYTPTYGGYGEGSLAYYWNTTDTSPDVNNDGTSSHFLLFYSDVPYVYPGFSVKMNREHIWPKSHASFAESYGGSDLHHLRPSAEPVNTAKSDLPFGYVDEVFATGYETGLLEGAEVYKVHPDEGVFEPKDDVKGDIARILLYIYCCWKQPNLYSDVPAEYLPDPDPDDQTNYGTRVIVDLPTLLNWCEDDPVDTWEMSRNDLVQQIQGNRNVFIDYPELAWKLFGKDVPAGMQTPTHEGCAHAWGDPVYEAADCTGPGSKRETCATCGNEHTMPTPALGHVDEDDNRRCDRCDALLAGTFHRVYDLAELDHVLIYHPASGKAMGSAVNTNNRMKSIGSEVDDDTMTPADGVALMRVEPAGESGFRFVCDGKYLTTPQSGNKLYWSEEPDACATWTIEDAGDGTFCLVNTTASYNGKPQALEYFNGAFTTYTLADSDAFRFALFSTSEHAFEEQSRTEPHCTEPGTIVLRCRVCGATSEEEVAAPGHDWGAWTTTREATATEDGEATRTCKNDATHVETKALPATGTSGQKTPDETEEPPKNDASQDTPTSGSGTAAKPSAKPSGKPSQATQDASQTTLPKTGDPASARWPLAMALAGALVLALGAALRRA